MSLQCPSLARKSKAKDVLDESAGRSLYAKKLRKNAHRVTDSE